MNKQSESIKEILYDYHDSILEADKISADDNNKYHREVDMATIKTLSQISALLISEMEKERIPGDYDEYDRGRNNAIQACQDIVKKMCGGVR